MFDKLLTKNDFATFFWTKICVPQLITLDWMLAFTFSLSVSLLLLSFSELSWCLPISWSFRPKISHIYVFLAYFYKLYFTLSISHAAHFLLLCVLSSSSDLYFFYALYFKLYSDLCFGFFPFTPSSSLIRLAVFALSTFYFCPNSILNLLLFAVCAFSYIFF